RVGPCAFLSLSVTVAIVASVVALTQADTARHRSIDTLHRVHVLSGSLALAGGIWAMHFIGMLAVRLPVSVSFHDGNCCAGRRPPAHTSAVDRSRTGGYSQCAVHVARALVRATFQPAGGARDVSRCPYGGAEPPGRRPRPE